jgi:hypothetical protein
MTSSPATRDRRRTLSGQRFPCYLRPEAERARAQDGSDRDVHFGAELRWCLQPIIKLVREFHDLC